MNKDSKTLQFEEENDSNAHQDECKTKQDTNNNVLRKSYRIPLSASDHVQVHINNKSYTVSNITHQGIQILFSQEGEFYTDQILDQIELSVENNSLLLKGKIVYVTLEDPETFSCGVDFGSFLQDDKAYSILKDFIDRKYQELFSK